MDNSFTIQTLPCMVSLLGESQTFKIGDRIEVYNTITKKIAYNATIIGIQAIRHEKGHVISNLLTSAKLISL